jgi:hypothetical protein
MSRSASVSCVASLFLILVTSPISAEEVRSRGPIHEAFAQPLELQAVPTPVVPKQPPAPIVELLPEQRPDGENIRWLPGYWAWDAERQNYLWVSGVFRQLPNDRQFVPGYWSQADQGWRWVPGFWAAKDQRKLVYLPEPPDSVETGPQAAAPHNGSVYQPGYWKHDDDRFLWQPGRWVDGIDNQMWVSPRYQWTPNGYLFVDGYYDFPLAGRGQLFASASFAPGTPLSTLKYRPTYALNLETILTQLFYRPGTYQYSIGDYFGPANFDYKPWFTGAGRYDAMAGYYQWANRLEPSWFAKLQTTYDERLSGRVPPPLQILEGRKASDAVVMTPQVPDPNAANANNNNNNPNGAQGPFGGGFNPFNPFNPFGRRFKGGLGGGGVTTIQIDFGIPMGGIGGAPSTSPNPANSNPPANPGTTPGVAGTTRTAAQGQHKFPVAQVPKVINGSLPGAHSGVSTAQGPRIVHNPNPRVNSATATSLVRHNPAPVHFTQPIVHYSAPPVAHGPSIMHAGGAIHVGAGHAGGAHVHHHR